MPYLAAVEVDQRQRVVTSADKLKEMLGGSWTIEDTRKLAEGQVGIGPVKAASGDLWFQAERLDQLTNWLWVLREKIVDEFGLPCSFAIVEERETLQETRKLLMNEIRRIKDGRGGEVGHVSLPWCTPCQIQPNLPANCWYPSRTGSEQFKRRSLVSQSSDARLDRGFKTLEEYYGQFSISKEIELIPPDDLNDFAPETDSYLAVLRFDADKASDLFKNIDLSGDGWSTFKACSEEFDRCLKAALKDAFESTLRKAGLSPKDKVPISPLIAAGDDFLIITRRDLAMEFAFAFLDAYTRETKESNVLPNSKPQGVDLTLSGAVVFARAGFPFSVLSEISVDIEKSAKSLRRQEHISEPCLDLYWLESTGREEPLPARKKSLTYQSENKRYSFITSPWTLPQAKAMWDGAKELMKIPRGKWHQLLAGLKAGEPLASFHYQRWLQHLPAEQQKAFVKVTKRLALEGLWPKDEGAAPWVEVGTKDSPRLAAPLLELHQLREMFDLKKKEAHKE